MTDPTNATVKTIEHEEASRLPDTSWLWRRVLIFVTVGACLWIAYRRSEVATDPGTIRTIIRYCFAIIFLGLTLYGVGATVTDVTRLITAFLSTKRTTETSAPPPATVTDGRAETPVAEPTPVPTEPQP